MVWRNSNVCSETVNTLTDVGVFRGGVGGGLARTERDFQYIKERRHSSIGSSTGISFENVLLKYKNTFFLTSNKLKKYEYWKVVKYLIIKNGQSSNQNTYFNKTPDISSLTVHINSNQSSQSSGLAGINQAVAQAVYYDFSSSILEFGRVE